MRKHHRILTLITAALLTFSAVPVSAASSGSQQMYRLYNPNSGEHFYTASTGERDYLDQIGWNYEGIGWTAPKSSNTPVYRLYNANAGDHHYTMSKTERDWLVSLGWNYEGIGWYSDDAKSVPLYRQYNPNAKSGSHNYTVSKAENDILVSYGWHAEGIGWYGIKSSSTGGSSGSGGSGGSGSSGGGSSSGGGLPDVGSDTTHTHSWTLKSTTGSGWYVYEPISPVEQVDVCHRCGQMFDSKADEKGLPSWGEHNCTNIPTARGTMSHHHETVHSKIADPIIKTYTCSCGQTKTQQSMYSYDKFHYEVTGSCDELGHGAIVVKDSGGCHIECPYCGKKAIFGYGLYDLYGLMIGVIP